MPAVSGALCSRAGNAPIRLCFLDDGQPVGVEICGNPVIGNLADLPELRREYGLLVAGTGNNQFRAQVYEKAKALGYAFPNIIAPSAYISPFAQIGCGCVWMQNACIQNGSAVGNGVLMNAGTEVHCDAAVGGLRFDLHQQCCSHRRNGGKLCPHRQQLHHLQQCNRAGWRRHSGLHRSPLKIG